MLNIYKVVSKVAEWGGGGDSLRADFSPSPRRVLGGLGEKSACGQGGEGPRHLLVGCGKNKHYLGAPHAMTPTSKTILGLDQL